MCPYPPGPCSQCLLLLGRMLLTRAFHSLSACSAQAKGALVLVLGAGTWRCRHHLCLSPALPVQLAHLDLPTSDPGTHAVVAVGADALPLAGLR